MHSGLRTQAPCSPPRCLLYPLRASGLWTGLGPLFVDGGFDAKIATQGRNQTGLGMPHPKWGARCRASPFFRTPRPGIWLYPPKVIFFRGFPTHIIPYTYALYTVPVCLLVAG